MAVVTEPTTVTIATETRTWRATLDTPKGGQYGLTIHRERRSFDDQSGDPVGDKVVLPPIDLAFDDIKDETVTIGGLSLKVSEIAAFLAVYFDQKGTALGA